MKLPVFIENMLQKGKSMTAKERWMVFLLTGLLLAIIIFPVEKKESGLENAVSEKTEETGPVSAANDSSGATTLNQYERYLSRQLEEILSQMEGAGQVQVWVTISGSSEKILFQESESEHVSLKEADSVGGTRTEESDNVDKSVVLGSDGNPYIIKTLQPKVEGVLVIAEGADNSTVKKNISEAVEVLFGIDAHRIKVAKKKVEE